MGSSKIAILRNSFPNKSSQFLPQKNLQTRTKTHVLPKRPSIKFPKFTHSYQHPSRESHVQFIHFHTIKFWELSNMTWKRVLENDTKVTVCSGWGSSIERKETACVWNSKHMSSQPGKKRNERTNSHTCLDLFS